MRWRDLAAALAVAIVAVALRAMFLTGAILHDGGARMQEADPWYQLRAAKYVAADYPRAMTRDPYLVASRTAPLPVAPGLPLLAASAAAAIDGGTPSGATVERVAAWLPPLLAGLGVIALYFAALAARDRAAALAAALVLAILPGQLFQRSTLGFFDQHPLELLFLLALAAALIAAVIVRAEGDGRDVAALFRSRWPALAAGAVAIALYCLSWRSAPFGIAMVAASSIAALVARRGAAGWSALAMAAMLAGGSLLLVPLRAASPQAATQIVALLAAACLCLLFAALAAAVSSGRLKPAAAAAAGAVVLGAAGAIAWGVAMRAPHGAMRSLLDEARRLYAGTTSSLVAEAQPLWAIDDAARFLWSEWGLAGVVAVASLPLLMRESARRRDAAGAVVLVLSAATIVAMVLQVRFGYYAAAGVAIVTGLAFSALRAARPRLAWLALAIVVATTLPATLRVAREYYAIPDSHRALYERLATQTPEPFGDAGSFLRPYGPGEPRPVYSIAAWWDAGYWITSIGRRVPVANPTQEGAAEVARLLLAEDQEKADARADAMRARYVVIDEALPFLPSRGAEPATSGAFPAMARWSGEPLERYFELVDYDEPGREPRKLYVFYPAYYRTLASRLYLYQGQGVGEAEYWVGTFATTVDARGATHRRLTALTRARSYVEAMNAELQARDVETRVLGIDPLRTCIPLEPLGGYRLVDESGDAAERGTGRPSLMLFERSGP